MQMMSQNPQMMAMMGPSGGGGMNFPQMPMGGGYGGGGGGYGGGGVEQSGNPYAPARG